VFQPRTELEETERTRPINDEGLSRGAGSTLAQSPRRVFVVGSSRSGTTMLARMLGNHSALFALNELHFVEELWLPDADGPLTTPAAEALADRLLHNQRVWYHAGYRTGRHADEAREIIRCLSRPIQATDVFAEVLARETQAAGKRIAVEQTPRTIFYLAELLERLPDSRAVVLTRDPRDVVLSQKNWWRRRFRGTSGVPWRTTFRQWADYHPATISLIWRGGARTARRLAEDPRITLLRFEDLIADPASTLTKVLAPLGLQLEAAMLDVPRISSSNSSDRDGHGVDPSVVGRYTTGLSSTEIWLTQRVTHAEAAELGYSAIPVSAAPVRLLGLAILWPAKSLLALALNYGRSRSLVTSAIRRLRP
jgi:omega-hydroxy-beta-dihydromenaquinone-9 sulfotransferase